MRIVLVDFENVHSDGVYGIENLLPEDKAIIFYSMNADSLTFDLLHKIMDTKAELNYYRLKRGGKNALDFQLCSYLGYLINIYNGAEFYVISKDSGFDFALDLWSSDFVKINSVVRRFPAIRTMLAWTQGGIIRRGYEDGVPSGEYAPIQRSIVPAEESNEQPTEEEPEEAISEPTHSAEESGVTLIDSLETKLQEAEKAIEREEAPRHIPVVTKGLNLSDLTEEIGGEEKEIVPTPIKPVQSVFQPRSKIETERALTEKLLRALAEHSVIEEKEEESEEPQNSEDIKAAEAKEEQGKPIEADKPQPLTLQEEALARSAIASAATLGGFRTFIVKSLGEKRGGEIYDAKKDSFFSEKKNITAPVKGTKPAPMTDAEKVIADTAIAENNTLEELHLVIVKELGDKRGTEIYLMIRNQFKNAKKPAQEALKPQPVETVITADEKDNAAAKEASAKAEKPKKPRRAAAKKAKTTAEKAGLPAESAAQAPVDTAEGANKAEGSEKKPGRRKYTRKTEKSSVKEENADEAMNAAETEKAPEEPTKAEEAKKPAEKKKQTRAAKVVLSDEEKTRTESVRSASKSSHELYVGLMKEFGSKRGREIYRVAKEQKETE